LKELSLVSTWYRQEDMYKLMQLVDLGDFEGLLALWAS